MILLNVTVLVFQFSTERVFFISSTENALVVVVWRGGCNHVAQIKGSRLLCGVVGGRIKWCQPTTSVQVFQALLWEYTPVPGG